MKSLWVKWWSPICLRLSSTLIKNSLTKIKMILVRSLFFNVKMPWRDVNLLTWHLSKFILS
jgi:hypothetical protein